MASCSIILLSGSGLFRILPCPGCLIFWKVFKLVKKLLQRAQLIRTQQKNLLNNLFSIHFYPFLPEYPRVIHV